jgi:hypothetical protein
MAETCDAESLKKLMDVALRATNFARSLNYLAQEMDMQFGKVACRGTWIDLIELAEFAAFELDGCGSDALEMLTDWGNTERTAMAEGHPDPYRERFDKARKTPSS